MKRGNKNIVSSKFHKGAPKTSLVGVFMGGTMMPTLTRKAAVLRIISARMLSTSSARSLMEYSRLAEAKSVSEKIRPGCYAENAAS